MPESTYYIYDKSDLVLIQDQYLYWCFSNGNIKKNCALCDKRYNRSCFNRHLYRKHKLIASFICIPHTIEDKLIIDSFWNKYRIRQHKRHISLYDTMDGYLMRRLAELPKMPMVAKLVAIQFSL